MSEITISIVVIFHDKTIANSVIETRCESKIITYGAANPFIDAMQCIEKTWRTECCRPWQGLSSR